MSRTHFRKNFTKIFIYTLTSILLISPAFNSSYLALAEDVNETIEQIERFLKHKPNSLEGNLRLAVAYANKYSQTKEIRYLDLAIEKGRKAVQIESEFLPANMLLYMLLSQKAIKQRDVTLFRELNEQYQAISQSSLKPKQLKNIPHPSFLAALVYYRISADKIGTAEEVKYENKAINELKKAIRIHPDVSIYHLLLGRIYYYQDKNDLALLEVKEAIRLEPRDPDNYLLLGDIHQDNIHRAENCWDDRAITQGIQAYKEATILAPNHPYAHLRLSSLYIHRGAYNLAVQESKEAVNLYDTHYTRARLGSTLLHVGDYEQGIKELNEALHKEPSSSLARSLLAFAYFLQNKFERAIPEYQKYIEQDDSPNPYAILDYHLALKHIGKHEEAEKVLKKHAKIFAEKPWRLNLLNFYLGKLSKSELLSKTKNKCQRSEAFFYIAHQYLLAGDKAKAHQSFQKTLDMKILCSTEYVAARSQIKLLNFH